jgi:hypothetical protein
MYQLDAVFSIQKEGGIYDSNPNQTQWQREAWGIIKALSDDEWPAPWLRPEKRRIWIMRTKFQRRLQKRTARRVAERRTENYLHCLTGKHIGSESDLAHQFAICPGRTACR